MELVESRLLGLQIDEAGREVVLSFIDAKRSKFDLLLHGVERLLVNEFRQQNVVEGFAHWAHGSTEGDLREAAFVLMTGFIEKDCGPELSKVASNVVDRIIRGELEMMEVTAIFGAQILASFASMTVRPHG
jgi:hypothetical protein